LSQPAQIKFDSVFKAPIVRAQFDVLMVLAEAMAPALPDLYRACSNWHRVVVAAAESLASQMPLVQATADAQAIWGRVLLDLGVQQLTAGAKVVIDSITTRLALTANGTYDGGNYLEASHTAGVRRIRHLGTVRAVAQLRDADPFPVRARYNPRGDDYCASSSLIANEIGWNLQLVERSLYGVLIFEMLFQHEYLSHLLPRNNYLSKQVREIWLSDALYWELVYQPGERAAIQVKKFLWEKFRRELARSFDTRDIEFFGPLELDHLVQQIRVLSDEVFWDITKAILECADGKPNANLIDSLLMYLVNLDPLERENALKQKGAGWEILREFHMRLVYD
jgi:hypothetical protein